MVACIVSVYHVLDTQCIRHVLYEHMANSISCLNWHFDCMYMYMYMVLQVVPVKLLLCVQGRHRNRNIEHIPARQLW